MMFYFENIIFIFFFFDIKKGIKRIFYLKIKFIIGKKKNIYLRIHVFFKKNNI